MNLIKITIISPEPYIPGVIIGIIKRTYGGSVLTLRLQQKARDDELVGEGNVKLADAIDPKKAKLKNETEKKKKREKEKDNERCHEE